jgi:hypothetical protein
MLIWAILLTREKSISLPAGCIFLTNLDKIYAGFTCADYYSKIKNETNLLKFQ